MSKRVFLVLWAANAVWVPVMLYRVFTGPIPLVSGAIGLGNAVAGILCFREWRAK